MKTFLRWIAKRAKNTPSRLIIGCIYGMWELFGPLQCTKDVVELSSQIVKTKIGGKKIARANNKTV